MFGEMLGLSFVKTQLSLKKENLEDLKACKTNLKNIQQEFLESKDKITEPALSSDTWQGSLANKFEFIRDEINTEYQDLKGKQLNEVITKIEDKINTLIDDIDGLKNQITSIEKEIEKQKNKNSHR
ncbi:YwqH-like family protein [Bacillus tequilensis]|uniref:DUF5082 domain-containing protein n=1 Tax=Bacillus tequilensis TaxID=227866 RepID=A0A6H0WG11_9BACI|nr:DUF5082 family protein [Bacillus tequilensis]QIW79084.1 DUF5082 domain-containing protein [Bacillus tequilensis]